LKGLLFLVDFVLPLLCSPNLFRGSLLIPMYRLWSFRLSREYRYHLVILESTATPACRKGSQAGALPAELPGNENHGVRCTKSRPSLRTWKKLYLQGPLFRVLSGTAVKTIYLRRKRLSNKIIRTGQQYFPTPRKRERGSRSLQHKGLPGEGGTGDPLDRARDSLYCRDICVSTPVTFRFQEYTK